MNGTNSSFSHFGLTLLPFSLLRAAEAQLADTELKAAMSTGTQEEGNAESHVDSIPKQVRDNLNRHARYIGKGGRQQVKKNLDANFTKINALKDLCGFSIPRVYPAVSFLEAQKCGQQDDRDVGALSKIYQNLLDHMKVGMEEKLMRLSEPALEQMLESTVKCVSFHHDATRTNDLNCANTSRIRCSPCL